MACEDPDAMTGSGSVQTVPPAQAWGVDAKHFSWVKRRSMVLFM
jgi:hypothetical protein